MNEELLKRLEDLDKEDFLLGIFIVIIALAYIANKVEREYFIKGQELDKIHYYYLQSSVFIIVFIINVYLAYSTYNILTNLPSNVSDKTREYAYLDFVASAVALVASLILLYIAVTDINIESDISI